MNNKLISSHHTWRQTRSRGRSKQSLLLHLPVRLQEGVGPPESPDEEGDQMALAGGAVDAERSPRSGSLAEAPPEPVVVLVGESGS